MQLPFNKTVIVLSRARLGSYTLQHGICQTKDCYFNPITLKNIVIIIRTYYFDSFALIFVMKELVCLKLSRPSSTALS